MLKVDLKLDDNARQDWLLSTFINKKKLNKVMLFFLFFVSTKVKFTIKDKLENDIMKTWFWFMSKEPHKFN